MIDERKLLEKINDYCSEFDESLEENKSFDGYNIKSICMSVIAEILDLIQDQPKVGEWIPVEEREPSCSCTCLTWVKAKTTYSQYEKCVLANYYDGFFDVFPFDVFPYIDDEPNEVQILAWMPLPESYSSGD